MIRLYALDLRTLDRWQELIPTLPPQRQARIHGCRMQEDRLRLTGAGWLLQQALVQEGVPPSMHQFDEAPGGKPFLSLCPDLHVSLSHSGHWAVCALADHPVGVDVEQPRCTMAVARRHFAPEELAGLTTPRDLTRLWTAKEAFVKALGTGLTIPLNSFLVLRTPEGLQLTQTYTPLPYRLHEYDLEDCPLCLCTTEPRPELFLQA